MSSPEKALNLLKNEYPDAKYYLDFSSPLELLVAAILSAQARDEVVNSVTKDLFKKYKKSEDYSKADLNELVKDIKKISFAGNKAKNIIGACRILAEKYNGKVPDKMDELVDLPGIGRKTANAILQNAFNIVEGIVVDTHVIRVSYRLGWTKNTNPEKIEQDLMKSTDKKHWKEMPHLLKAHGRAICKAPLPSCSKCVLNKLCPKQGVIKKD